MTVITSHHIEQSAQALKQVALKHLDLDDAVLMSLGIFTPLVIHKATLFKKEYIKELYDNGAIFQQWTLLQPIYDDYAEELPELKVIYPRLDELSKSFGSEELDLSDIFYAVYDLFVCMEKRGLSKLQMLDVIFESFYQKDTDNFFEYSANEFMFHITGIELNESIVKAPFDNAGQIFYGLIKNMDKLQPANLSSVVESHHVKNYHTLLLIMFILQEGSSKLSSWNTSVVSKSTSKVDIALLSLNNKLTPEKDISTLDIEHFEYGLPQKNRPEFLYIQDAISSLKAEGAAYIITPVSVLYRTGSDKDIRQKLVEANLIDTLIFLPKKYPTKTSSPMAILIVRKNRVNSDTLFLDAETFIKENKLIDYDAVRAILKTRETISHKTYSASFEEIVNNDFNLNLKHYIQPENKDVIEPEDNRDIAELIAEFIERERLIEEKYQSILNALKG